CKTTHTTTLTSAIHDTTSVLYLPNTFPVALNFIDAPMQKNHTARMGTVPVIIPLVNDPKYFPAPGEKVWHSAPRNSGTSIIPPGIFSIERFICISITCRHIFKG